MSDDARPIVENRRARLPRFPAETARERRIRVAIAEGRTIERGFPGEPGWHAITAEAALQLLADRMELWLRVAPPEIVQELRR